MPKALFETKLSFTVQNWYGIIEVEPSARVKYAASSARLTNAALHMPALARQADWHWHCSQAGTQTRASADVPAGRQPQRGDGQRACNGLEESITKIIGAAGGGQPRLQMSYKY